MKESRWCIFMLSWVSFWKQTLWQTFSTATELVKPKETRKKQPFKSSGWSNVLQNIASWQRCVLRKGGFGEQTRLSAHLGTTSIPERENLWLCTSTSSVGPESSDLPLRFDTCQVGLATALWVHASVHSCARAQGSSLLLAGSLALFLNCTQLHWNMTFFMERLAPCLQQCMGSETPLIFCLNMERPLTLGKDI